MELFGKGGDCWVILVTGKKNLVSMIGNEDPYIKQAKNQTLDVSIQQIADELGGKVK